MARSYSDLDTVKRLLRSIGAMKESKVRFSEAYKDLKPDTANSGNISLSGVTFSSAWAGHENFTFSFTDATSFDVVGDIVGSIGSGTTQANFSSTDRFTVSLSNWIGAAEIGDKWYIRANSDMSDDDGDAFISDASEYINSILSRKFDGISEIPFYSDVTVEVPGDVAFACARLAAYEIWNSVFAGLIPPGEDSPVEHWKKSAIEALDSYIAGHGSGPRWKSRDSLITEVGVEGVGEGIIEISNLTDSTNKTYNR